MAVYVDDMRNVIRNKNWRYSEACHMVADTEHDLHVFARRLNLKRSWFQYNTIPHYDLTKSKRIDAVLLGAIEITDRQLVEMIRKHRKEKS